MKRLGWHVDGLTKFLSILWLNWSNLKTFRFQIFFPNFMRFRFTAVMIHNIITFIKFAAVFNYLSHRFLGVEVSQENYSQHHKIMGIHADDLKRLVWEFKEMCFIHSRELENEHQKHSQDVNFLLQ